MNDPVDLFAKANEIELCYRRHGDSNHPTMLLISGIGQQLIDWPDYFIQSLLEAGYQVIRFDNRDVGHSQKFGSAKANLISTVLKSRIGLRPKVPYQLEDMAADAVGLLDTLKIDKAHIVGISMGGMISQLLASRYPQRVLSLNLLMTSSGRPGLPGATKEVAATLRHSSGGDRQAYFANWLRSMRLIESPNCPVPQDQLEAHGKALIERSHYPIGFYRQMLAIVANGSRVKLLKKLRCVTQVIHGVEDTLVPYECGVDVARCIPNAKLESIDGMSHDLPKEMSPHIANLIIENAKSA